MHPLSSLGDSFCCCSCFGHFDWSETISHTVGGHVQPLKTPKETEFVRETVIMSIRNMMARDMKCPSTTESHQQGPWTKPTAMKQIEKQVRRGDYFNQVDGSLLSCTYVFTSHQCIQEQQEILAIVYHSQLSQQSRKFCRGVWRCLLCTDSILMVESLTALMIEKFLIINLLNVGQVG